MASLEVESMFNSIVIENEYLWDCKFTQLVVKLKRITIFAPFIYLFNKWLATKINGGNKYLSSGYYAGLIYRWKIG